MTDIMVRDEQLIEKVIIGNDLSGLTPIEKVQHIKNICQSLGLNPLTKPIALMKFQGKEIPYVTRDGAEQLRKLNKVSIYKIEPKMVDQGIYVVTAYARLPDGREDTSTGAVGVVGLKGDALGNALMKCETKAKRRVTLSICGLGFISEEEVESLNGAQKVQVNMSTGEVLPKIISGDLKSYLDSMETCTDVEKLKDLFFEARDKFQGDEASLDRICEVKNRKRSELEVETDEAV